MNHLILAAHVVAHHTATGPHSARHLLEAAVGCLIFGTIVTVWTSLRRTDR